MNDRNSSCSIGEDAEWVDNILDEGGETSPIRAGMVGPAHDLREGEDRNDPPTYLTGTKVVIGWVIEKRREGEYEGLMSLEKLVHMPVDQVVGRKSGSGKHLNEKEGYVVT
jgi:hypothetical protein